MRWSGDLEENKRIYMDLEVVLKCHDCPFIVSCYGCFITDADVWICMELMSTSFDKLSKLLGAPLPEDIIGKVAFGVSFSFLWSDGLRVLYRGTLYVSVVHLVHI